MNVENRLGIELSDKLSTGSKLRNEENGSLLVGSVNGSETVVSEMRLSCVVTEEMSRTPKMSTAPDGGFNGSLLSLFVKLAGKAGFCSKAEVPNGLMGRNCGRSTGTSVLPDPVELNTLFTSPLFQESKEVSGLLLPGKSKVCISLVLLGSGISGKEPASILFERDPEDFLDCVCGQISKEESEMLLLGKLKVGNPLLVILGNLGREPSLILADLIGSPGVLINGISVQTSGLAVVVATSRRTGKFLSGLAVVVAISRRT